jgi:membrane protein YqaA with SNARE-associated domain
LWRLGEADRLGTVPAARRHVSHRAYDGWQRFSESRAAAVLIFVWALGEATVSPILADFLLAALMAVSRARRLLLVGACLAGMAVGGIVTVVVARTSPGFALDLLRDLPLVTESHIQRSGEQLAEHGVAGFFLQPVSGIPFKAWAVMAGQQGLAVWLVIPAFIVARAIRMVAIAALAQSIGGALQRGLRDWFAVVAVAYVVLFAAGFVAVVL